MPNQRQLSIAIIGLGNVGLALSHLFTKHARQGLQLHLIAAGRNVEDSIAKLKALDIDLEVTNVQQAIRQADVCLLTVKDSQIKSLCELHSKEFKPTSVVAHCSGSLDSEILISAKRDSGASICSMHPLNTFPTPKAAILNLDNPKHNTFLYVEGDQSALDICDPLFTNLGFNSLRISRDAKPAYHAACVFASNYLVSLIDASLATAQAAGINSDQFTKSIMPLAKATLANIEQDGMLSALSGPIARGDADTDAQHIDLLSAMDSSLHAAYVNLGLRALELAKTKGNLSESSIERLNAVLNS